MQNEPVWNDGRPEKGSGFLLNSGSGDPMADIGKIVFDYAVTHLIYSNEDNYRYERRSAGMEVLINKEFACVFRLSVNAVNMTTGETDESLAEIAGYLAFSSQKYFQTVFRRVEGCTPLEYRLKHR